jgi:hypothetical protein
MWFYKRPGETVLLSQDEPALVLMGKGALPDWVRLHPELGGSQARVMGSMPAPCPMCFNEDPEAETVVRHMKTDAIIEGKEVCVAECDAHGFVWYKA